MVARSTFLILISLLVSCAGASMSRAEAEPNPGDQTVRVMVLGTFHFTGGGSDVVNPDVDDFLAPARQAEIAQVLDGLQRFRPDKIMLEMTPEHAIELNASYRAFLQGEHALSVNERQQIGFRLAGRLGHDRLYGIDDSSFLDYRGALKAAEVNGQERLTGERERMIEGIRARVSARKGKPLRDWLVELNDPSADDDHYGYLTIAQMGTVEDPRGAREIIGWWERNLVMFARASMVAEPGDRILIVVGAGHLHLLREFFRDAKGYELVDSLDYLRGDAQDSFSHSQRGSNPAKTLQTPEAPPER